MRKNRINGRTIAKGRLGTQLRNAEGLGFRFRGLGFRVSHIYNALPHVVLHK